MDTMSVIYVLHALENGTSSVDLAREYGVQTQIIADIHQQKDVIIRNNMHIYNILKEVRCIYLDQTLLDWLIKQMKEGKVVKDHELCNKAQEVVSTYCNVIFHCIEDWLRDFQKRHNIVTFVSKIKCSLEDKNDWYSFVNTVEAKDIYISIMSGLFHSYSIDDYVKKKKPIEFVSLWLVVNCLGTDKHPLVVAGQNDISKESIRSLPVNYFYGEKSIINYNIIESLLRKWDQELKYQNRNVHLLVPEDVVKKMKFDKINLVPCTMDFVNKCLEKLVECYKYHYRRLLITKKVLYVINHDLNFLDYLHLMGAAWQTISATFIQMLFFPLENGSLYLNSNNFSDDHYSLSEWYIKQSNKLDLTEGILDSYVLCDQHTMSCSLSRNELCDMKHANSQSFITNHYRPSTTSAEAYQAIKRLISYLQSNTSTGATILEQAKELQNNLEYDAQIEMHIMHKIKNNTK